MEEKSKLSTMQKNSSTFQVTSSQPSKTTRTIDRATQERGTSTAKRRSSCLSRSRKGLTRTVLSCRARARKGELPCPTIPRVDSKTQCSTQWRSETLRIASRSAIRWKRRMIRARTMYIREAFCRVRCSSRHRTKICQLKVPSHATEVCKFKVRAICCQIGCST